MKGFIDLAAPAFEQRWLDRILPLFGQAGGGPKSFSVALFGGPAF